jgi:hypothetical protein
MKWIDDSTECRLRKKRKSMCFQRQNPRNYLIVPRRFQCLQQRKVTQQIQRKFQTRAQLNL